MGTRSSPVIRFSRECRSSLPLLWKLTTRFSVESLDDRILNHLRPMESDISAYDARARTFPASFLRLTNLPLAFFTAIRRSPSVLRTILDHVRAAEFLEHYDLPKFPCIVALTPTAAGTGFDFQSLETLGDSFLKLAVTINAYMSYPTYEEGQSCRSLYISSDC